MLFEEDIEILQIRNPQVTGNFLVRESCVAKPFCSFFHACSVNGLTDGIREDLLELAT